VECIVPRLFHYLCLNENRYIYIQCIHFIRKIGGIKTFENNKDTTLRIKKNTKEKLHSLDFVKKDSDNDIIECLIDVYSSFSGENKDRAKELVIFRRKRTKELKEKLRRLRNGETR